MGSNQISHLGITFPADFPLDSYNCFRLAYYLLFYPRISATAAKALIDNKKFWISVNALDLFVQTTVSTDGIPPYHNNKAYDLNDHIGTFFDLISEFIEIINPAEKKAHECFFDKLYAWVLVFSFPKYKELEVIAQKYQQHISIKTIYESLFQMIFEPGFPEEKMFDFLSKYFSVMPESHVNKYLDFYQSRSDVSEPLTLNTKHQLSK
jgi:hypothetical protein